jgi:transposase
VWEVIPVNSKAYSARKVNLLSVDWIGKDRDGQPAWVGVDVGKVEMQAVVNWAKDDFERPWKIGNPGDIAALIEHLKRLAVGRRLTVALEPSGTYGDALRQACHDAGITVHRVAPKVAHDYAEVFDGVPSQHDGKDAAVVAELARCGKSAAWPWTIAPADEQQIEYWVDRMDAQRRLRQMWCGRIEARLARHWPEVLTQLKLTSPTLLNALIEYGGPAALAADAQAAGKLKGWGRTPLTADAVARIVTGAGRSMGVRQQATDLQRMRDYAREALAARQQVKEAQKRLRELSRDHRPIQALAGAVGNASACVLFAYLGDPGNYPCGAAYVKAMGLNLTERSSGMYKGKLKISKRGSGVVRYWMYLAALRLARKNSPVRPWYLRKKSKESDQAGKALVAIMRRLGLALYHVAASGEAFEPARLFPGRRRVAAAANAAAGTAVKGDARQ